MKRKLTIVGAVVLLLLLILFLLPGDRHRRDRISAEQSYLLGVYGDIWNRRAASEFQSSVPQVLEQITKEEGAARLKCPVHGVPYVIQLDSTKWTLTNRTAEVAVFCPQPHFGRIISAQFNGAVGRIKRP